MFSRKTIKIDTTLYDSLSDAAGQAGYASTEEFILHVLEREVADRDDDLDRKHAEEQLRGLGYIE